MMAWLASLRRKHFPSEDEMFMNGFRWALDEIGTEPLAARALIRIEDLTYGCEDPFDKGARFALRCWELGI